MKRFTSLIGRSAILAALVATPMALVAQQHDSTRSLSGKVTNESHQPVEGAVVKVQNAATKGIVSYITDTGGNYSFKRLRADTDYTVWADLHGDKSKQKTLDHFNAANEVTIDLALAGK